MNPKIIIGVLIAITFLCKTGVQNLQGVDPITNPQEDKSGKQVLLADVPLNALNSKGKPIEGIQLSIMVPKSEYAVGEVIEVRFSLKNVTRKKMYIGLDHNVEKSYPLTIHKETGGKVEMTALAREYFEQPGEFGGGMGIYLNPNESSVTRPVNVNEIYTMDTPGTYLIFAERIIQTLNKKGIAKVRSGTIKIVIRNK